MILAVWLLSLPFRLLTALGLRRSVILACLFVLAVTAYGVAEDLGLIEPPAQAAPARRPAAGQPSPSRAAVADIPGVYLRLYRQTGARYRIPWPVLASPNPDLKPEKAVSAELAVERKMRGGRIRLSLFNETVRDALVSQLTSLPGFDAPVNHVQNVDRTRTRGIELAFDRRNLLPGLDLSGSITIADPKTVSDPQFPAAEGKLLPQVPRRRATLVATWRPSDRLSLTAAARYSSRLFGTIDNSDVVGHTYQGFEGYFVADVRAAYRLTPRIDVAAGVENLTDKRYFLFHPFPGRTFTAEVHWHL